MAESQRSAAAQDPEDSAEGLADKAVPADVSTVLRIAAWLTLIGDAVERIGENRSPGDHAHS